MWKKEEQKGAEKKEKKRNYVGEKRNEKIYRL